MQKQPRILTGCLTLALIAALTCAPAKASQEAPRPEVLEGFVQANGVRLQYIDWGGTGSPMILIHGLADDPQVFNALAPALTDHFHVIAYARRGSGASESLPPYDVSTLTEDLRGLMDALAIKTAIVVGYSAGGDEATELASAYPQRVERVIYLDSGYDYSDPQFRTAYEAFPPDTFDRPAIAMKSFAGFLAYQQQSWYRELRDPQILEGYLREKVVIQTDGSLRDRMPSELPKTLLTALWANKRRHYEDIRCPVLAIYTQYTLDVHAPDQKKRAEAIGWERTYWMPYQKKSTDSLKRDLANVEVVRIPDSRHGSFLFTHRQEVVRAMRRFLLSPDDQRRE